ncbi:MAG: cyclic nucleotide-binding domain-containing protein [Proteobacteria bacterium]|nr:cyclic nucleotide-binding domain-containing protein [Pseudomonadota bacterium]
MVSRDDLREVLDPETPGRAARWLRAWHFLAVSAGVALAIGASVDGVWSDGAQPWLAAITIALLAAFAVLYGLRLWVAGDEQRTEGEAPVVSRWRYATSPMGMVDLSAFLPMTVAFAAGVPAQQTALLAVLWILKLTRYSPGLAILGRVVRLEREPLAGVFLAFAIALFFAATLAHVLERDAQPDGFGTLPKALWWAITTLTTTGYGDAVPLTPAGRLLGGTVMMCGILVFALWAGILATGFSEEVRRRGFLRTYDLVQKVPFFRDLGASLLAELARLLKPREFPAGSTVVRRGQAGDCMYFIVSGDIEVRTEPKPLYLHAGSFFGEIALITGGPRIATAVATKHTTLLVLDIADFRELAAKRPELAKAIHDEADRRQKRAPPADAAE